MDNPREKNQSGPYGDKHWHVSRSINLGHIMTTLVALLTALWFFAQQDTRISRLELSMEHVQASRVVDQGRTDKQFDDLRTDLRSIDGKLDRLIEGRYSNER